MKNSFLLGMGDDFRVKILVPGRKHFFLIIGYWSVDLYSWLVPNQYYGCRLAAVIFISSCYLQFVNILSFLSSVSANFPPIRANFALTSHQSELTLLLWSTIGG